MTKNRQNKVMLVVLMFLVFSGAVAAETLIGLHDPVVNDIMVTGFELKKDAKIDIEAVGIRLSYQDNLSVYAWILNNETRELVWSMEERRTDRVRGNKLLRKQEKSIDLKKGKYELYLWAGENFLSGIKIRNADGVFDIIERIFDGGDYHEIDEELDECYVTLSSNDASKNDIREFRVTGDLPNALLKYNKLGDDANIKQGFTLEKDMNIRIYAVFEYPDGYRDPVDYGWIINADTRDRVWEIDRWNTDWAGGGDKNRVYNKQVKLKKGNYILQFVTDDSHSYPEFNTNPPYDPYNWGITILTGDDFERDKFKMFDPPGKGDALVDLTRARDDVFLEQPFAITKETKIHVYAIGEFSSGDREFADKGWIQNAATGEIVWEMTRRNTEHAGGGRKNRMFDGEIMLPKGEYVAYYITDDSHSYRDWNDSPPYDPQGWGLAIYKGPNFRDGSFKILQRGELSESSNILAKMVMMRDHDRGKETFTLDKQTRVRIYAIGEGSRSEMYDYGWIVDKRTGRSAWEMTWRNTEPAGGARKNRMFNGEIVLDPGNYEVYYETDGSHSFNDWNAARPHDPINWGITISIIE